jgi:hypothetical protein
MAHLLGHARISTSEQHPDLQVDALKAAGCYRVFVDTASGALAARPALDQLRPGDTLVVWSWIGWAGRCAPVEPKAQGYKLPVAVLSVPRAAVAHDKDSAGTGTPKAAVHATCPIGHSVDK